MDRLCLAHHEDTKVVLDLCGFGAGDLNRQGAKDAKTGFSQVGRATVGRKKSAAQSNCSCLAADWAAVIVSREPPERLDTLVRAVLAAAIEVHRCLGPGFLESVYEEAIVGWLLALPVPVVARWLGRGLGRATA